MTEFVQVVVEVARPHTDRLFTYLVPEELGGRLQPGHLLRLPWGQASCCGFVTEVGEALPPGVDGADVKPVLELLHPLPLFRPEAWALASWLREFYFAGWPAVLQTMLPGPVLEGLKKPPKRARKPPKETPSGVTLEAPPPLTEAQSRVWEQLSGALEVGETWLLHGVTGSGKTEIYLKACQQTLERGLGVMVLVPEVSLTPQARARFSSRFGSLVSILHSGLTDSERRRQWWRIRDGEARLVVGTRSAVFAPVERLGLIVIDEEHDASYKQSGEVRYHARQVAAWLSRQHRATLLLGSATPCLETFALSRQGRYRLLSLPERVQAQPLPRTVVVKGWGIPGQVLRALRETRERGHQSVVLLNRRGFARYLLCQDCGWVPHCQDCSISLTYHRRQRLLRCHYCGASQAAPSFCGECQGQSLDLPGQGTERIESELATRLPELRVARLDRDTVGSKSRVFEEVYGAFAAGEIDCLLGTQMVSKGLDFPTVTLVVVLEADSGLHLPDFRASERTFSLLTQVAGRAGRGELPGTVLLVCHRPDHPLFAELCAHRWESFMESELAIRQALGYPPYRRMLRLLISHPKAERCEASATDLGRALASVQGTAVEMLGPAPCPLERLQDRYRWHILLKAGSVQDLQTVVRKALQRYDGRGARVAIDPDPLELL